MAKNKVIYGDTVIMDITDTTADESSVLGGKVFYKANGDRAIGTGGVILYDTTSNWNSQRDFIPTQGSIVVYSDYATVDGTDVPNIKIGDGLAYLIDLPFVEDDLREDLLNHINNTTVHITAAERSSWNNKVTCSVEALTSNDYNIVFSKD